MNNLETTAAGNFVEDVAEKYLTFDVSGQVYGISISNVIEISKIQAITPIPEFPVYAKGIINLRGKVIPLIDLNLRFGHHEKEYTDRTCIVIVDIEGLQVGFIVEAVDEVMDISKAQIAPPPKFSAERSNRYVVGVGKLTDRMVLILDGKLVLSDDEVDMLGSAAQ
ncbi:chemotaxis protein CheW [Oscillospiraceae bacterium MB08-C2-2]|nr:chemotaxis protein CheW [Oscillospiraceae bacterium MB08-C2-2]